MPVVESKAKQESGGVAALASCGFCNKFWLVKAVLAVRMARAARVRDFLIVNLASCLAMKVMGRVIRMAIWVLLLVSSLFVYFGFYLKQLVKV